MTRKLLIAVFLVLLFIVPLSVSAGGCPVATTISNVSASLTYLENRVDMKGGTDASCVTKTLQSLRAFPSERAVIVLTKYLGFPRPPKNGEAKGFFSHAPTPIDIYPAVASLIANGKAAAPSMFDVIRHSESEAVRTNAAEVLSRVYRSSPEDVITLLLHYAKSANEPERGRLTEAVKIVQLHCSERPAQCDAALRAGR